MALRDEIGEQPEVIARALEHNRDTARLVADLVGECTHAVIAARGTSDNAGRYAQYVWGTRNRLSVGLTTPSLFSIYDHPPLLTDALVVGISQSGQSPDIVSVLEEGKTQHRPTVAFTNDPESPLAKAADVVVNLGAGAERSVAATKTYTSTLATVALISDALDVDGAALDGIPASVTGVLGVEDEIERAARAFTDMEHCAVLGRGFNHATAFEWALKLQELTQVVAQPFSTADFLHGPVAVIEPGYPVLAVSVRGPAHAEVTGVLERAAATGARLVTISDDPALSDLAGHHITIPGGLEEWLTPVPAIVAAQLFAFHLTLAKGLDPEQPRGLKKVTRTT
ncbi:MAG TPA: SIS domain-containing protein [Acidimicrobiia bacterium]|nr:SIS domain-containing protein [Acidimicrobiia bacterium]